MVLKTPDKIRNLQRKLYLKAKSEPDFRFYLLYDKIYRKDIFIHAYRLVKANSRSAGTDGVTVDQIASECVTPELVHLLLLRHDADCVSGGGTECLQPCQAFSGTTA
jgi:RNA-directed DNA polymerase